MLELKTIDYLILSKWFIDFQKKSKCLEIPPDEAECLGIYENNELIGYFIVLSSSDTLDIVQGYLSKEARHKNLSPECMRLLEYLAKKAGHTKIRLQTQSRFKSYIEFMKAMKYKPTNLVFSKEI